MFFVDARITGFPNIVWHMSKLYECDNYICVIKNKVKINRKKFNVNISEGRLRGFVEMTMNCIMSEPIHGIAECIQYFSSNEN